MKQTVYQLVRYIMVGASATAVDYGFYYLLTRLVGLGVFTANPLAYFSGNIVSFLGHRSITFRSAGNPYAQYLRFIIVTGVGLAVSQLVLWLAIRIGIHDLVAKAASVLVSGLFNYLANRFWTFRPTGGRP